MEIFNDLNAEKVLAENELVMVDFWAEWCQPCKFYKKVLETIDPTYKIYTCDIDGNENISNRLDIRSIPTSIFFKNGIEVKRLVGVQGKPMIEQMFQQLS